MLIVGMLLACQSPASASLASAAACAASETSASRRWWHAVRRRKNRTRASREVQRVPPTWTDSRTTPLQPADVQRYKVETCGRFPRRRRGSSLDAAEKVNNSSCSGSINSNSSSDGKGTCADARNCTL